MLLLVSAKHERQCDRCRHWFWAHDSGRTSCYLCKPDTAEETKKELRKINAPQSAAA